MNSTDDVRGEVGTQAQAELEIDGDAVARRLTRARKTAGLTQKQLADQLGVIERTVQHYEAGRVPWRHLARIAEITGVERTWLLHGEPTPAEQPADLASIEERLTDLHSRAVMLEALMRHTLVQLDRIEQQLRREHPDEDAAPTA